MNLLLNFGLAWISVILAVLLSIIYLLRKSINKSNHFGKVLKTINQKLRKYHKYLGVLLVITGLVHGLFSSQPVLKLNFGTIAWVVSILLGLNWMFRKYFNKYRGWIYYHRVLTVCFLLVLVIHIADVGIQGPKLLFGAQETNVVKPAIISEETLSTFNKQFAGAELKDGVYEGEANGFRPGLTVSVTVKGNKITSIEITNHNEVNSRYYQKAMDAVPQEIIESQSLEVDAISGATFTSTGIVNAVNDALSKAVISGELPEQQQQPENRKGHRR